MNTPKSKTSGLEHELTALKAENKKLRDFVRSFVADADAMRSDPPADVDRDGGPEDKKHWFGGFSNTGVDEMEPDAPIFEWPCLSILIEQGKELLK